MTLAKFGAVVAICFFVSLMVAMFARSQLLAVVAIACLLVGGAVALALRFQRALAHRAAYRRQRGIDGDAG